MRDAHGHPGNGAVAPDRIGDDLGGLLASGPAVRYRASGRPGRPCGTASGGWP